VKATFTGHLAELRRRLIAVCAVYALATVLSYPLAKPLLLKIRSDLLGGVPLVVIEPQEAVVAYVNVSMLIGLALALPAIAYHVWAFIAPGLAGRERKTLLCLVAPSAAMFIAGVGFGYYILLPVAFSFLLAEAALLATPMISLGSALSFITSVLAALGLVFQMPLVSAGLARLGVLRAQTLANHRRHAIVAIVLVAGIITPDPSVVPQLILSVPMIALYEAGIWTARLAGG
jgi:sec-independent protein translocase protein TatC